VSVETTLLLVVTQRWNLGRGWICKLLIPCQSILVCRSHLHNFGIFFGRCSTKWIYSRLARCPYVLSLKIWCLCHGFPRRLVAFEGEHTGHRLYDFHFLSLKGSYFLWIDRSHSFQLERALVQMRNRTLDEELSISPFRTSWRWKEGRKPKYILPLHKGVFRNIAGVCPDL
jgi:hypothetical protein